MRDPADAWKSTVHASGCLPRMGAKSRRHTALPARTPSAAPRESGGRDWKAPGSPSVAILDLRSVTRSFREGVAPTR